jgi:hypothetical protein
MGVVRTRARTLLLSPEREQDGHLAALLLPRGKTVSYELFCRFVRAVDVEPADFSG